MTNYKLLVAGILVVVMGIAFSSTTWAQSDSSDSVTPALSGTSTTPRSEYVTALPTTTTQKAAPESSMQPSTDNQTPPKTLSSALGLGPNSRIHINGFLSAGGAETNSTASYIVPNHGEIDSDFNFSANSLVGLQFTVDLAKHLDVVTQFVADGDTTSGETAYRVNAEWAYLRYTISDSYELRAGRFRLPAFLYSETEQVGYSYPYLQLPNEVYRIVPFDNLNGMDMIYRLPFGKTGWILTVQPYYGESTSQYAIYNTAIPNGLVVDFDEDNIRGVVASVGNKNFTLRGTYSEVELTGNIPSGSTLFSSDATDFYSFGLKWNIGDLVLIGEYADRDTPSQIASLLGYYGTIGWRFGKFLPIFTYAYIETTNANALLAAPLTSEVPQNQQSYTLGFDYTLNDNLDVKASVSQITPLNGTNGLFNTNPGKSHIYLWGISVDAIF